MPKPKSERSSGKQPSSVDQVTRELILSTYAKVRNFASVAREFGLGHSMKVKRMWDALSDEERDYYLTAANDVREAVKETISLADISMATDCAKKLQESLGFAVNELHRRLRSVDVASMKDKELLNAVRLLASIASGEEDPEGKKVTNIFTLMDAAVSEKLMNKTIKTDKHGK